jgi:hypothetical protein
MSAAPVLADGIPSYTLGQVEPERFYPSLFESRQLARVDVVNDTHERIDLFLSVYSLEPGDNLTIMVPLRTLPTDVSGQPMNESEFRKRYLIDRAEKEVVRQDPDEAWGRFREEAAHSVEFCFGSMLLTMPGEYIRENVHLVSDDDDGYGEKAGGGLPDIDIKPEPVQHYEFDGFSIDVFGVAAGPALADYLAEKGLVMPTEGDLGRYDADYIAVVEGETRPPINATEFALLQRNAPNATLALAKALRTDPTRSLGEIRHLKSDYAHRASREYIHQSHGSYSDPLYSNLSRYMEDLVEAVFGSADFAGEALTVVLPLDDGRAFFPLGTSAGWPNVVGDIDVLFRVPEGKDIRLQSSTDAFFSGGHFYLFQMHQANPAFDLESDVRDGSPDRVKEAARAGFLYDNSGVLGACLALVLLLLLWSALALMAKRSLGTKGRFLGDPVSWLVLGLSIVVSIPGALLIYLMARPVTGKELTSYPATSALLLIYPMSALMLIAGALL